MKNYIQINNKKIELPDETAKDLKNKPNKPKGRYPEANSEGMYDYWYIKNEDFNGCTIDNAHNTGVETMRKDFACGMGFKTKKEAERKLEWMKTVERVKDYIHDNNMDFEPDWNDSNTQKYVVVYEHQDKAFSVFTCVLTWSTLQPHSPIGYFRAMGDVQKVIDNCKDDLKIIFDIK